MQKWDFGQLNIMPRHTFLRKGYDSTHRRAITKQQVKTAFERMLQGVVTEVPVCPLCEGACCRCGGGLGDISGS